MEKTEKVMKLQGPKLEYFIRGARKCKSSAKSNPRRQARKGGEFFRCGPNARWMGWGSHPKVELEAAGK